MKNDQSANPKQPKDPKAERHRLRNIKKRIMAKEKDNFAKLYVFPSGKVWYKMGWNSALIYKYILAPRLKIEVHLRPDNDYGYVSDTGIISFQNLQALEARLEKVGARKELEYEGVLIFDLGFKTTAEELESLRKADDLKWAKVGAQLIEKELHPDLWKELRGALELAYHNFKSAPSPVREFIEYDLATTARKMTEGYIDLCNGIIEWPEYYKTSQLDIAYLKKKLRIAMELKAWEPKKVIKMVAVVHNIDKIIYRENLKKQEKIK